MGDSRLRKELDGIEEQLVELLVRQEAGVVRRLLNLEVQVAEHKHDRNEIFYGADGDPWHGEEWQGLYRRVEANVTKVTTKDEEAPGLVYGLVYGCPPVDPKEPLKTLSFYFAWFSAKPGEEWVHERIVDSSQWSGSQPAWYRYAVYEPGVGTRMLSKRFPWTSRYRRH